MKMRIRGDSIRLRVTRPELEAIKSTGEIKDSITFGANSKLDYCLDVAARTRSPTASFSASSVLVSLPQSTFETWANSDDVSIEAEQRNHGAGTLSILVEKDFACLAPREGEEQSEMFANPDAGKVEC